MISYLLFLIHKYKQNLSLYIHYWFDWYLELIYICVKLLFKTYQYRLIVWLLISLNNTFYLEKKIKNWHSFILKIRKEIESDVITAILLHQLKQYDSLIVFCYLSFIRCLGKNSWKLSLLAVFFISFKLKRTLSTCCLAMMLKSRFKA